MLHIDVPGRERLALADLVLDFNGTIACDGRLLPSVPPAFTRLADILTLHVLTADTYGSAAAELAALGVPVTVIPQTGQAEAKAAFIDDLGASGVVAVGNGVNDALMLERATLGIAVMQDEGVATAAVRAADILVADIARALDLLLNPLRLKATLRR